MKVVFLGASGMVGAGALREALAASDVESVLSVIRAPTGVTHPKLRELVMADVFDVTSVEDQLVGYDACIWAIGVSSSGLDEKAYARVTEELTLTWARTLLRLNPKMSFCYCSAGGAGGPGMWARVRRRVEDALKAMPFTHVGAVRPGFIRDVTQGRVRLEAPTCTPATAGARRQARRRSVDAEREALRRSHLGRETRSGR